MQDLSHLMLDGGGPAALTGGESMVAANGVSARSPLTCSAPGSPSESVAESDVRDPAPGPAAPSSFTSTHPSAPSPWAGVSGS